MQSKDKAYTPSDADISSGRSISRRWLLGTIAIGAIAAAVVTAASVPLAEAAKLKGKTQNKKAGFDYLCCIDGIKGETRDDERRRARRLRRR